MTESEHTITPETPIINAYWVLPNTLLAGEYPAFVGDDEADARLTAFLNAGVTFFLDLTVEEEYNVPAYAPLLKQLAAEQGRSVHYLRLPIRDMRAPTPDFMQEIQHTLQVALERGEVVYVHCFGGIGRTGTVIGCYLVEKGRTGEEAIAEIAQLRQNIPSASRQSPETRSQCALVLAWKNH